LSALFKLQTRNSKPNRKNHSLRLLATLRETKPLLALRTLCSL
jgi:hypothetical protein